MIVDDRDHGIDHAGHDHHDADPDLDHVIDAAEVEAGKFLWFILSFVQEFLANPNDENRKILISRKSSET